MKLLSAVAALLAAGLLLAGCKGTPTHGEKNARSQAATVAAAYRPEDKRPDLPVLTNNSSLADFVTFAELNQPRVEAAYYDWLASIERITTARSFPDPQITFQMDIQNLVTSVMPGVMMNLPARGKRHAAADVATAETDAKYFNFQSAFLEAAFEVKRAYFQHFFLEDKLRLNRDTLNLLSDLEKLARAQNEVGKVTLQDVLRAQIEQDRLRTEVANLEDSRTALAAQWKAALGLGTNQPPPPLPQIFESTPLDLSADKILEIALAENTRLKALAAEVRAADAAIRLADTARRPESSVGVMADVKMNPILYRPVGTVSLPIWRDKIAAQLAEAQAGKRAAEARLSAEQINLAVDVAAQAYAFREAGRNVALLHDDLLPKQRQSLEVARSGYVAGQIDFFNLTDAEQTLLRFALAEVEARSQRELAGIQLSLILLGLPPPNTPMASNVTLPAAGGAPGKMQGGMK